MIAPVHRLRKKDIIWLSRNRCKHSHTYLEHYNCMLEEMPDGIRKVGFLDIETSNLKGNFGIMFTYCIKELGKNKIHTYTVCEDDLKDDLDFAVVNSCVNDMKKFDRLITYYGTGFDLPFIRTRATYWGIDFPEFGEINHVDLYYLIRNKFSLHSNRLDVACKTLLGKSNKTYLDSEHWIKALQGNKKALQYITEHCKQDVLDLEKLYDKVFPYRKDEDKSI